MRRFDVRWRDFRSLEDTGWIEIKPITIVIGANASGKTSLIAPLLLLKQTLESADPTLALRTQGRYFNAGSYDNLVCRHEAKRTLAFSVRFRFPKGQPPSLEPLGVYPPGEIHIAFSRLPSSPDIQLSRLAICDLHGREMLVRQLLDDGTYSLEMINKPQEGSPFAITVAKAAPAHFLFTLESFFAARFSEERDRQKTDHEHADIALTVDKAEQEYISTISFANSQLQGLVGGLAYIGPLRERPRRLYEVSGENPRDVGGRGQFAPEILFRRRSATLIEEINRWVERFDFGFRLQCRTLVEGAFELVVQRSEDSPWVNLADTGFGLSQILPLIVQGFYGRSGSVVVAEQPEIHLNPRLQSVLADLFVAVAKRKVGVLVETHSEHLLLRLRRLIADKVIPAKDVAIYYVEREGDSSSVRPVPVAENGHIEPASWPRGFFDESLREALALAAAQSQPKHAP